jgi:hypothetical protein
MQAWCQSAATAFVDWLQNVGSDLRAQSSRSIQATALTYETQYRAANDSVISVDMTKEYSRVACCDVGTPQRVHDMPAACHVTALA